MRKNIVRFSPRLSVWFYTIFGVLFFSGIFWLAAHYYEQYDENFSDSYGFFKPWMLRLHGAAAMGSLVILGVLVPLHMRRAWAQKRNRFTAVGMVAFCILLVASGYGLYYCGDENWRSFLSGFHSVSGCTLPFMLIWHIVAGRKEWLQGHPDRVK